MPKKSAGLLMFRHTGREPELFLVHFGGPFWAKKDDGAWFVPKGEIENGEDEFAAAKREFTEETGFTPREPFLDLGSVRNKSGKTVRAWAFEGDADPAALKSNTFTVEWPPRSGKQAEFPEVDRGAFFALDAARVKMHPAEAPFLDRLEALLRETAKDQARRG
jgi:predicted NUDIX family NTP pyrophosphohydrolase